MEVIKAVSRKFKISYLGDNIIEQTVKFINEL
jgi:hypothetical protein